MFAVSSIPALICMQPPSEWEERYSELPIYSLVTEFNVSSPPYYLLGAKKSHICRFIFSANLHRKFYVNIFILFIVSRKIRIYTTLRHSTNWSNLILHGIHLCCHFCLKHTTTNYPSLYDRDCWLGGGGAGRALGPRREHLGRCQAVALELAVLVFGSFWPWELLSRFLFLIYFTDSLHVVRVVQGVAAERRHPGLAPPVPQRGELRREEDVGRGGVLAAAARRRREGCREGRLPRHDGQLVQRPRRHGPPRRPRAAARPA